MYEIAVLTAFDFRSAEYRDLFARSAATAFQHPIWLSAFYDLLVSPRGAEPVIVTVRDRDSRLVCVLPLVRRRYGPMRVIEFADLAVTDYAAPIAEPGVFPALLADRSVRARIRKAIKPFDLIRIAKVPDGAPAMDQLLGLSGHLPMPTSAHSTPLDLPFEQWREQRLNPSFRKELDRKSRQLGRKGDVRFGTCPDAETIRSTVEAMREYRRPRFAEEGGDLLHLPDYLEFYLRVATEGIGGLVRTYALTIDGRPIAATLGLAHRGHFLVLLCGFDLAGFKNYSVGALTFDHIARDCIERGDTLLDFTIGDESYKTLFGAETSPMWMSLGSGSPVGVLAQTAIVQLPWARNMAKRVAAAYRPAKPLALPQPGG